MRKTLKIAKQKAPNGLFENKKVGRTPFKPLLHKEDKSPLKDYEYFELLGRKVVELEKTNPTPNIPINFSKYGFDLDSVEIGKKVCEAIDDGRPVEEIQQYINNCIDFNK